MDQMNKDISGKLKVLDAAYGSVLDVDDFDELVSAWDQTYLKEMFSDKTEGPDLNLSLEEIEKHFERALKLQPVKSETFYTEFQSLVDREVLPSFVLDRSQHIVARNAATKAVSLPDEIDSFDDLVSQYGHDLVDRLKVLVRSRNAIADQILVQSHPESQRPYFFHLSIINVKTEGKSNPAILVRIIETVWKQKLDEVLSSAFELTDAEIETTRLLTLGHNAAQISELRERSLDTVRNQIRSVLSKTRARGQVELIRMLTLLSQTTGDGGIETSSRRERKASNSGQLSRSYIEIDGRKLEYARFGNRSGPVLFYIATSSVPEETVQFRNCLETAGFDVVAPYRPGFSNSDRADHGNSLSGFSNDCLALLERLELQDAHVVGHREGGVFAARLACQLEAKLLSLTIINTGVPLKDLKLIRQAPLAARRSLQAAVKAPKALAMGYRLAARIFGAGIKGESKIMEIFYSGSPIDAATYTDSQLREVTRRNLAYCFQNSDAIVKDIAVWASDWSEDLEAVQRFAKVLFIHSSGHEFMLPEWIKALCKGNTQLSCRIVPMSGQTLLYTHTKKVVEHLSDHALTKN